MAVTAPARAPSAGEATSATSALPTGAGGATPPNGLPRGTTRLGMLLLLAAALVGSVAARRGRPAGDDPWDGHTLEWATSSPPPSHNFERLPEVRSETPVLDMRESAGPATTVPEGAEEVR